jgi:hypothetical protein
LCPPPRTTRRFWRSKPRLMTSKTKRSKSRSMSLRSKSRLM